MNQSLSDVFHNNSMNDSYYSWTSITDQPGSLGADPYTTFFMTSAGIAVPDIDTTPISPMALQQKEADYENDINPNDLDLTTPNLTSIINAAYNTTQACATRAADQEDQEDDDILPLDIPGSIQTVNIGSDQELTFEGDTESAVLLKLKHIEARSMPLWSRTPNFDCSADAALTVPITSKRARELRSSNNDTDTLNKVARSIARTLNLKRTTTTSAYKKWSKGGGKHPFYDSIAAFAKLAEGSPTVQPGKETRVAGVICGDKQMSASTICDCWDAAVLGVESQLNRFKKSNGGGPNCWQGCQKQGDTTRKLLTIALPQGGCPTGCSAPLNQDDGTIQIATVCLAGCGSSADKGPSPGVCDTNTSTEARVLMYMLGSFGVIGTLMAVRGIHGFFSRL